MEPEPVAALRAGNDVLRDQADSMLEVFQRQQQELLRAGEDIAATRVEGWSVDRLVRVTVNAAGVPADVWLAPQACKNASPERLAASFAEAAREAAQAAQARVSQLTAPLASAVADLPDMSEIVPGAPDFRKLLDALTPPLAGAGMPIFRDAASAVYGEGTGGSARPAPAPGGGAASAAWGGLHAARDPEPLQPTHFIGGTAEDSAVRPVWGSASVGTNEPVIRSAARPVAHEMYPDEDDDDFTPAWTGLKEASE